MSIAAFIVVFTGVVLVHELGHFLAARRAGVKVYEFSIGFPFSPRIIPSSGIGRRNSPCDCFPWAGS
jgi:membrane-associated protease RseP (regulator of RpoE activity)